jgi:hypothetical protein
LAQALEILDPVEFHSINCNTLLAMAEKRQRLSSKKFVTRVQSGTPVKDNSGEDKVPVVVHACRFCDDGRYAFPDFQQQTPLYQFQVLHDTRPSVMFQFLTQIKQFVNIHYTDVTNLADLEKIYQIRIVLSGGDDSRDPDMTGVLAWRVGIYSATENPGKVLELIEAFVKWKGSSLEFAARGIPSLTLTDKSRSVFADGAVPPSWTVQPPGAITPHPFDASPARGRRHLLIQLENGEEDDVYDIMFFGGTWAFRIEFDTAGVQGGIIETGDKQEYVRLLKDIRNDEDGKERVAQVLATTLKGQLAFLLISTEDENDEMASWMRALPSVHSR